MAPRIVTGLFMAACAIALLSLAPPVYTWVVVQIVAVLLADEFFRMTMGPRMRERIAGMAAATVLCAVAFWAPEHLLTLVVALPPLLLCVVLFSSDTVLEMGPKAGFLLCGTFYLGMAMAVVSLLVADPGPLFLLALFGAVFGGDTGAFFAGKFLGKGTPRLYEKISPKKTRVGSVGGALGSVVGFLIIATLADLNISIGHSIALGLGAGLTGQVGDLAESLFKRAFGVKDSGTLLPGHGGVWDRIDGIMFAAPYVWIYLRLSGI